MNQLPSAYTVQPGREQPPRWYPLRFGKFRRDSHGERVSFAQREDAEAFCWREQREYERTHPSSADH